MTYKAIHLTLKIKMTRLDPSNSQGNAYNNGPHSTKQLMSLRYLKVGLM
jgi:hypothetical protein